MTDERGSVFHGAGPGDAPPEGRGQNLVLALIISVATLVALGLTLVWLNIERTKLQYRMRTLQHDVGVVTDLNAKLTVEREHLLSPRELGKKAERMGLGPARTGQIRRMDMNPETDPVPGGQDARHSGAGAKD